LHEKILKKAKELNKSSWGLSDHLKSDFEKYCPKFLPLPNSEFSLAQGVIPPKHLPLFQSNLFLNVMKPLRKQVALSKLNFDQWPTANFDWSTIKILSKLSPGK